MKPAIHIKQIEISILQLPMLVPFVTGFGAIKDKTTILVKICDSDGVIGWGEAATLPYPLYIPESTDVAFVALIKYLIPRILDKKIHHPSDIYSYWLDLKGYNLSRGAIENALWMIYSIKKNRSISSLIHGTKTKIPVGDSIGIQPTIQKTLADIKLRLSEHYRRIKIKIKPGWDIKLVEAIRTTYPDLDLMVDANSSYRIHDLKHLKKLDNYNLTMIEQPLEDDDIIYHGLLQKQMKTPICLDESIHSISHAEKAIGIKACKIINIKPGRVGGITPSRQIHDCCQKNGIGVWCGGMLETGIGKSFNMAVSSLPNFKYPADMSPSSLYYKEDLIEPTLELNSHGYIPVPTKPGLGSAILYKKIKKYTVKHTILK